MDTSTCAPADIIEAATPVLLALVTGGFAWLTGWAKGMRTPRREEHALRAELDTLKRESPTPQEP